SVQIRVGGDWLLQGRRHGWGKWPAEQALIDRQIVLRHPGRAESSLELPAHGVPVKCNDLYKQSDGLVGRMDDGTSDAGVHNFVDRSVTERKNGGSARHGLDHGEPEWLRPVNREEKRFRLTQKFILFALAYLTNKFHIRMRKQRFDSRRVISLVDLVD